MEKRKGPVAPAVAGALAFARKALASDSGDREYEALLLLIDAVEGLAADEAEGLNATERAEPDIRPKRDTPCELRLTVPTHNGKWLEQDPALQEFDEPHVPLLVTPEDGVRIVLGTHDWDDFDAPDIKVERRHNGWMIFLRPTGGGDACGFVVFLDDGRSFVAPEQVAEEYQIKMVDYEKAVAELDDILPTGPSCKPTMIIERARQTPA